MALYYNAEYDSILLERSQFTHLLIEAHFKKTSDHFQIVFEAFSLHLELRNRRGWSMGASLLSELDFPKSCSFRIPQVRKLAISESWILDDVVDDENPRSDSISDARKQQHQQLLQYRHADSQHNDNDGDEGGWQQRRLRF